MILVFDGLHTELDLGHGKSQVYVAFPIFYWKIQTGWGWGLVE